jgi:hypothetical protein
MLCPPLLFVVQFSEAKIGPLLQEILVGFIAAIPTRGFIRALAAEV